MPQHRERPLRGVVASYEAFECCVADLTRQLVEGRGAGGCGCAEEAAESEDGISSMLHVRSPQEWGKEAWLEVA